jgi:CubicO group peptidase (beta-lactamase class C family)
MTLNIIHLFAIALLISCNNFLVANASERTGLAPKATAEEAKITQWSMPDSKQKFWDIPKLKTPYITISPSKINDGVTVGKMGVDGGNRELVLKLAQEIAEGGHGKIDSLLLVQKGKLLFESYYRRGRVDLPHPQSSVTKAYTGLALGRAIQLGYLTMADLNKPLISFLKEIKHSEFSNGAEKVTLHQALTMTTGIRLSDDNLKQMRDDPSRSIGQQEAKAILKLSEPITTKSQSFNYDWSAPTLVMQVIDAVVPGTAKSFIKNELFEKLGITNFDWRTAASSLPAGPSGASVTSRDMAKIGILTMNKGMWNGEQLIPESFVSSSTSRIIDTDDDIFGGGKDVSNQEYGYYWWNTDLRFSGKNYSAVSAQGGGGMYILLIEELDLIVILTAHIEQNNVTQQMIAERIIPVFIQ